MRARGAVPSADSFPPTAAMTTARHVLITGGAGFLGSHLSRALVAQGSRVTVLDDLSAGCSGDVPRDARLVVADVREPASVRAAARGCDLVLHLACVVGVDAVTAQPERTDDVIRRGTAVALAAAREAGAALMSFSSSEVTDVPREGPRAVYARAKRWAEDHVRSEAGDLPALVVRPFNVVGPGQSPSRGSVVPTLARAAARGATLPIHGDGEQTRTFLHVDDLVAAVLALLGQPWGDEVDVVEIGSPHPVTIAALAERLSALAGGASRVERRRAPARREDRPRRRPDLDALRRRVPFEPRRDLDAILTDVLADARGHALA